MGKKIKRGSIWWIDLPLNEGSFVQGGARPCVVVSSEYFMKHQGTVLVCPLTTHLDDNLLHPKVFNKKIGQVLCNQVMTVDKSALLDFAGYLSEVEMSGVDVALGKCLCLI